MATPISEIDALVDPAFSGVAIGSRAVDRRRIEHRQPAYRSLMGRIFNLAVRCLALSGVRDTQCGFKLFPGDLGRALAGVQRIDGFAYDVELLVRARSGGHEIRELPVRWRHIEASRVRAVRHSMEMFLDLLRIWWWRISGQFRTPST
jgi:dolichyl-phosphate beta-glucosyltransferase